MKKDLLYPVLLFTILILSSPDNIRAQPNYTVVSLSSNEGLPTDEVKKVFQDKQGFIWMATPEGLIRYDGYNFKVYSTARYLSKGLITNLFFDISQDSKGNLWCATDHGVAKLNPNTDDFLFLIQSD
ncbi:MAG: two-component regulator propeller domain-containing protein [Breznakibacter sp.]